MAKLTNEQLAEIKKKAEGYKADMTAFLRNIVKYPGESCGEKEHVQVIEAEMKKVGFDEVIVDKMGNVYGFMGKGKRIFAFDSEMNLKVDEINSFINEHKDEKIFLFGFTFMI